MLCEAEGERERRRLRLRLLLRRLLHSGGAKINAQQEGAREGVQGGEGADEVSEAEGGGEAEKNLEVSGFFDTGVNIFHSALYAKLV